MTSFLVIRVPLESSYAWCTDMDWYVQHICCDVRVNCRRIRNVAANAAQKSVNTSKTCGSPALFLVILFHEDAHTYIYTRIYTQCWNVRHGVDSAISVNDHLFLQLIKLIASHDILPNHVDKYCCAELLHTKRHPKLIYILASSVCKGKYFGFWAFSFWI